MSEFLLEDVVSKGPGWITFLNEVFHYTLRITDEVKGSEKRND